MLTGERSNRESTEALKLFSSDPYRFDLIIVDQTMPKLTGMSLAGKILAIRPNIPVILCTGHSDSVSSGKAKEAPSDRGMTHSFLLLRRSYKLSNIEVCRR